MGKKRKDISILVEVSPTSSLTFDGTLVERDTPRKKIKRRRTSASDVPADECAPIEFGDVPDGDAGPSWTEPLSVASREEQNHEEEHNHGVKKKKAKSKVKQPEPEVEVFTETAVIAVIDKKKKKRVQNLEKLLNIERERQLQGGEEEGSVKVERDQGDVVIVEDSASVSLEDEQRRKKIKKSDRQQLESTVESDMSVVMEAGDTRKRKKHLRLSVAMVTTEDNMTANHMEKSLEPNFDAAELETAEAQRKKKKKTKKTKNDDESRLEPPATPQTATTEEVVVVSLEDEKIKRKKAKINCGGNVAVEEEEMESREKKRKKQGSGGGVEERGDGETQHGGLKKRGVKTGEPFCERDVKELKEFIPTIMSKSPQVIHKMLKYDLDRFRNFKKQGLALRKGRFSAEENAQITENVNNFLVLTGMESASHLLHPADYPEECQQIKKLRALHRFHLRIAEGVPRPWHQVYIRARKMFDEHNHKGRFTEEELHSLAKYHTLHGNNWKAISKKMDRSNIALEKRHCLMDCMHGPWKPEEVVRLKQAVRGFLERLVEPGPPGPQGPAIRKENLYTQLAWSDIAHQVQTRHWIQCRLKWMGILKTQMVARGPMPFARGVKGIQDKIDLINALYALQVDDSADIDWEKVAGMIGNVTPVHVQKNFYRLKVSRVPLANRLTYSEIIDFLQEKVVPKLAEKLESVGRSEATPPTEKGAQEVFLLNDILPIQEEEFCEVDNAHINQSDYGLAGDQDI